MLSSSLVFDKQGIYASRNLAIHQGPGFVRGH